MQTLPTRPTQQGFGLMGTVAIIAVVALLGFGGWYVWRAQSGKQSNAHTDASAQADSSSNAAGRTQQTDPNVGYVVIKEWGVRFKPIQQLGGIKYFEASSINGIEEFKITTKELVDREPRCGEYGILVVQRRSKESAYAGKSLGEIGQYHYYHHAAGGSLCSEREENYKFESQQMDALSQSLLSLEAAK